VNVCQRQPVNEVFGPLVTKFVRNFGREGATPIQRGSNASLLGRVRAVKLMRHKALQHLRAAPQPVGRLSSAPGSLVPANSGCRAAIGGSEGCHFFGQWRKRPAVQVGAETAVGMLDGVEGKLLEAIKAINEDFER
jgi:hypothetical protein